MMNQGIGQFESEARRLAGLGRNGDVYIAHLAEGETVVPMGIFDANPEMRNMLFSQMKSMGLEPERYIVGNELNSINPLTGQPEFFLKKVFNGVKEVLKDAAPIIIPIAINAALGPAGTVGGQFLQSAAVSGLTSLLTGAETEDALKNALIAGGIGAAQRAYLPQTLGVFDNEAGQAGLPQQDISPQNINFAKLQESGTADDFFSRLGGTTPTEFYEQNPGRFMQDVSDYNFADFAYKPAPAEPSFFKGPFNQGAPTELDLTGTREFAEAKQAYLDAGLELSPKEASQKALADLTTKYTPTAFDKFALPALGIGALAFLPEEEVEEEEQVSIQDYIDANYPPDYFDMDITQRQAQGPFEVPPMVGFGAEGGDPAFFPRRTGAIGPGIGSGTKDDVPAMLMDGEFVFTKKAVNGLGGGDENKGMQRMYDLMRNFEAMA